MIGLVLSTSLVLVTATRPFPGRLLILAAVVVFILVIVYILKIKNTFASIPRLEKPWIVLEGGVGLLFLGVLMIAIKDVMGISFGYFDELDDGIIAVSAVFILVAMVMMKRAWTVSARE